MHLGDGGRGERRVVELGEGLGHGPAERALDDAPCLRAREGRDAVLQQRELVGDVLRQQVAARRQRLAELDEDGPEGLERAADAHPARHPAREPPTRREKGEEAQRAEPGRGEEQVVDAVAHQHPLDAREPQEVRRVQH